MATRTRKKKEPEGPTSRLRKRQYGQNHAYYLDGQKLDGVTTLLGDGMRKPALEAWSANATAEYAVEHWDELSKMSPIPRYTVLKESRYKIRDEAARRGREVHRLAEQLLAGVEVEVPEELSGHVKSAVRFMDEWEIEEILTETSVWNERGGYGGTLDMVFTSRRRPGAVIIGDWKTNRTGIYGETALQLSAYENAEFYVGSDGLDHPMSELGITEAWAIWIRADGYSVYPMERGPEVFRTFQFVATWRVARVARTGRSSG
jgi:hypothetical protein